MEINVRTHENKYLEFEQCAVGTRQNMKPITNLYSDYCQLSFSFFEGKTSDRPVTFIQ